jgi:two-component system, chemotaxis family, CheB/CheR fusion protein
LVPPEIAKSFPIVGIGASAGGLEALSDILKHLPKDTGMGFVLVQHLDPDHKSALTQLLTRVSPLPVLEVSQNLSVKPNHVYVIQPNTNLSIEQGVLKIQSRPAGRAPHLSVDFFFKSLAHDQRDCAIGVILSGTASDGTQGMEAIKTEGGITFAQDESAKYDSMPRNAIAAGCVDFVLPPEGIAKELARIAKHPYLGEALARIKAQTEEIIQPSPSSTFENNGFKKIVLLLRNHSGVDFSLYKPNTIERRIKRRMVLSKVDRTEAYAEILRSDTGELEALYSDLLINVTSFFRNPSAFAVLEQKVFPKLIEQPRNIPVRIWVMGCSTGQEAYSIAMAFVEFTERHGKPRQLQVFATDLNEALVERGRVGFYPRSLVHELPAERLHRFFVEEDGGFRVAKFLREMLVFAKQNVLTDPPFSRLDLISCRNVLIYLEPSQHKRILSSFLYALKPERFLFLGESESVGPFIEQFQPLDRRHKIFVKKPGLLPRSEFLLGPRKDKDEIPVRERTVGPYNFQFHVTAQHEADRLTLHRFAPPSVLLDSQLQILQFRGDTSPFLRPSPGKATLHLLKMAREGLMLPLRAAIKKAKREKKPVRREGLQVAQNGDVLKVNLEVVPLRHINDPSFLVFFEDASKVGRVAPRAPGSTASDHQNQVTRPVAKREEQRRIADLESEVAELRDYLESVQEENEATNEELQSSNEEVTSSNEELQSINEELEASKEELESANEELTTLNDEMANRNTDLNRSIADFNNIHASVNLPILVLTHKLTLRRFTAPAEKLFDLGSNDIGRPLRNLRHNLEAVDLDQMIAEVIETRAPRECEVQDKRGHSYSLRARPYFTLDNRVDGAVLVVVDIDALKRAAREATAARDFAESILRTVRYPLVVLHEDLRVHTANASFYKEFKVSPADTEGRSFFELGNGQWHIPKLKQLLKTVLPRNTSFQEFEITHTFESIGERTMLLSASRLDTGEQAAPRRILLAINDITEGKQLEVLREAREQLARSNENLEKQIQARTSSLRESLGELEAFSYTVSHDMRAPLRSLQGFANIVLETSREKLDPKNRDYLERIARSASRLDRLIQDVLNYSKIVREQVPFESVDLDRLVRDMIDTYPDWQPPRAEVEIEGTLPPVFGNQAWLTQCFSNLLGNAVKFVAPGTFPHVKISAELHDDDAVVRVTDNGIGIAEKDRERIFQLFQRIRPEKEYEGTGIGLTIVRKAVERMGGQIGFDSQPGKGSTFWIQLRKA